MNERNGLNDPSNERGYAGGYSITERWVRDRHNSSILEIWSWGVIGLDVVRSRAGDGVVRILMMQMLAVAVCVCVCVFKFVCGMSVSVRTATGLKE